MRMGTIMVTAMTRKKKSLPLRGKKEQKRSNPVIPGRPEGPNPESITTVGEYGFRARGSAALRNDEKERNAPLMGGGEKQAAALYRLMAWLSPSYPVGAFSYSSGIEWAVEQGDIRDLATLLDWLLLMISDGAGFCDAVLFVQAHRATSEGDASRLREVAELAAAFAPSKERHLETTEQGRAFVEATRTAWSCDALDLLARNWDGAVAYPVAVATACAGHGIAAEPALAAFAHALAANWISAGVRLIPLGQTDGQRGLAALEPAIAATVARALSSTLDDIGSAAFRSDLASMRHETQYTRLFRS
jgi:urease accessory protein